MTPRRESNIVQVDRPHAPPFLRVLLTLILFAAAPAYADEAAAWAALREGGHIILMRHAATTPGVGDPPDFRLGDCATQRLLSDAGRAQAKAIGAASA